MKSVFKIITPLSALVFFTACSALNPEKVERVNHEGHNNHGGHDVSLDGGVQNDNKNHRKPHKMDHDQHEGHTAFFEKRENAVTLLSENKNYKISLFCNESPIPVGRIHDWTIHIETSEGTPVENAKVYIFGGMPMHNHEFPTVPRVKSYLGNGDYRVEGVKFNMIGHWEMHFNIEKDRNQDRVEFKIHM
ncbi:MAG: FixH family protein [Gammaproteobacteria bacterium]|nr:FixH family protein [Gammaproteobacteria bacterium]